MKIRHSHGYTIIELMISITLGLMLLAVLVETLVSVRSSYSGQTGQGQMQNAELTISTLLAQSIRASGFYGCSSSSTMQVITPSLPTLIQTKAAVQGYDAGVSVAVSTLNGSNDSNTSHWSPTLPSALNGSVLLGSDVILLIGQRPGTAPTWLYADTTVGSTSFSVLSVAKLVSNGWLSISNCGQASLLQINGTPVQVASGASTVNLTASSSIDTAYSAGAVVVPVSQLAYFVGHAAGSQSALYQAENTNGNWTITPLVSGVDSMRVWFGTGGNGSTTQYRPATNMLTSDWSKVTSLRIAFLLEGNSGSSSNTGGVTCHNQTTWTLLDRTITVPCDSRLRHVFTMTVALRNASL